MRNEIYLTPPASVSQRFFAAAGVFSILGGALAVGYFDPTNAGFFPVCPLYRMTGIACPGCGLTRGFHALFRGDILTALDYNAMLPAYLFIFGYFIVSLVLTATKSQGLSWKIFPPVAMYAFLIVALVFTVLRNLPVYPFSVLSP